jgi:uncharacterized protein with LGFP repeats
MSEYVDATAGEAQWPYVTQESNYVTIVADPRTRLVRVQFRDGAGAVIHDAQYDSVYKPSRSVAGGFAAKYLQRKPQLGEPLTSDHPAAGNLGTWQQFQYGYMFARHGGSPYVMYGRILDYWVKQGWTQSWLGFPTSDPYTTATGATEQAFQHGYVTLDAATGIITTRTA